LAPVGAGKSGGMSIVIRNLYKGLAQYFDIDIFVRGKGGICHMGPRLRVIHIDRRDTYEFAEEIVKYHSAHQYGLIHTHYWLSGVVGLVTHDLLRIPWLHTFHTVEILKTVPRDKARIEIEEEIMRSCDLVVSPTLQETYAIKRLYPLVRALFIPHGVDVRRFTASQNGHANILFVGRIEPIKGLHVLVDSLRYLKRDIRLTVIGGQSKDDPSLENIKSYAAGLQVDFVGQVKHRELGKYYHRAGMLVVPSYYESFGLVGLEAMASARPVVGFMHTGLRETVGNDAGILVNMNTRSLARAISTLCSDVRLRHRLGNNGRKKALRYDWSNIVLQYQRMYEKIIEE
jgi:D-inositol-3-phosphate glycosyltransferase